MTNSPLTVMQNRVRPVLPWRHVVDEGTFPYWIAAPLGTRLRVRETVERPGTYYVTRGGNRLMSTSTLSGDIEHTLEEAMLAAESYEAARVDHLVRSLTERLDDALTLRSTLRKGTA